MHKNNFSFLKISMFSFCLFAISLNVNAHNKVVVIPMAGDDVIVEVEVEIEPTEKVIFLTSTRFRGNLGGVAGADTLCQSEADAAGSLVQGKTFKAWISDPTTNNINKIGTAGNGRFMSRHNLPYVLVDGSIVASSFPDLLDGAIDNMINIDQRGTAYGFDTVWTGILSSGFHSTALNCNGWTSATGPTPSGSLGVTNVTGPGWTHEGAASSCNNFLRLYCIEQ